MIPYDDLVTALASWRQRQGLETRHGDLFQTQADPASLDAATDLSMPIVGGGAPTDAPAHGLGDAVADPAFASADDMGAAVDHDHHARLVTDDSEQTFIGSAPGWDAGELAAGAPGQAEASPFPGVDHDADQAFPEGWDEKAPPAHHAPEPEDPPADGDLPAALADGDPTGDVPQSEIEAAAAASGDVFAPEFPGHQADMPGADTLDAALAEWDPTGDVPHSELEAAALDTSDEFDGLETGIQPPQSEPATDHQAENPFDMGHEQTGIGVAPPPDPSGTPFEPHGGQAMPDEAMSPDAATPWEPPGAPGFAEGIAEAPGEIDVDEGAIVGEEQPAPEQHGPADAKFVDAPTSIQGPPVGGDAAPPPSPDAGDELDVDLGDVLESEDDPRGDRGD